MEFRYPFVLFLMLALPLIFFWAGRRKRAFMFFSDTAHLPKTVTLRQIFFRFLPLLRGVILLLLLLALARPEAVSSEREYQTKGVDIILSLDISGSMLAEDFKPENRLLVAKQEAAKFVRGRENDRIGLVIFAAKAFTQCPLTLDYDILVKMIGDIQIGLIPDGTAIGLGLATAVNRLRTSAAKSKVVILLTDGANNAGNIDPITAAELARSFNVKVYTICIGRGGLVPFPVNDPLFGKRYVQANVEIDEFTLKRVADITGGLFFRARDTQSLTQIYQKINALERTEIKVKEYRSYAPRFHWFVIPAILLLILDVVLSRTVLLTVP